MKVSSDQLDRIREATNIVDLVAEHVRLKKRGRNFIGLCPFHNEKTPSFNVLEDRGIFKCFGCGKGGDVFSFVMEMEALTFPEAVRKLAERAHIEIEGSQAEADEAARSERETLMNVLREAAAFYYRVLRSAAGADAKNYLRSRGLDEDIQRTFGLGFAPPASGELLQHFVQQGTSAQKLERVGLVARRDSGEYYERFRARVMFPVFNATGRIVGFGGRVLPNASKEFAKYINSPDTEIYHKSQILYGLFQAKDAIRRAGYAILVEGYADVLAVVQSGTQNVVAASGTSLTVEQLQLLKRYTSNIVLLFDADTAGKNATMRGIELAIEAGFDVSTVILPAGDDPDSFIRARGSDAFRSAVDHRQSFIETKAQIFEEQGAFRDPAAMAAAVRSIVETISKVPDAIKRALFIQKLGERFHLSEQLLSTELAKRSNAADERHSLQEGPPSISMSEAEGPGTTAFPSSAPTPAEGALLEALLVEPIPVARTIEGQDFRLDLIRQPHARELISYILQRVEEGDPPDLHGLFDEFRDRPEFESLITTYGLSRTLLSNHWDEQPMEGAAVALAQQAIDSLERADIEQQRTNTRNAMKSDPNSDEHLREVLSLMERPEMRKKLFQEITDVPPDE